MTLNLEEAKKKLKAEKPRDSYMVIEIDGGLVLPQKDGVALLAAMNMAERAPTYRNSYRVTPLDKSAITSSSMSPQDYDRYKVAAILGVSYSDVLDAEAAAAAAKQEQQTT